VSWPGRVKANQVLDCLVDFSDFLPTFAELAGVEVPQQWQIDGISFLPSLLGRPGKRRQWAFAEHRGRCWVRTQRWKLYDDGRLFDLKSDPAESRALEIAENARENSQVLNMLKGAMERLGCATAK
jgi:arylsulfatase A-like enzyme